MLLENFLNKFFKSKTERDYLRLRPMLEEVKARAGGCQVGFRLAGRSRGGVRLGLSHPGVIAMLTGQ